MFRFEIELFSISIVLVYKLLDIKTVQLNVKTVLFQTIQFSVSTQFYLKIVLFQTIQFSISTQLQMLLQS